MPVVPNAVRQRVAFGECTTAMGCYHARTTSWAYVALRASTSALRGAGTLAEV